MVGAQHVQRLESSYSTEDYFKVKAYLAEQSLSKGIRAAGGLCSIAAIRAGLELDISDRRPRDMSPVLRLWIIHMQDLLSDRYRNSAQWKELVALAPSVGSGGDELRQQMIADWVWKTFAKPVVDVARFYGVDDLWERFCETRGAEHEDLVATLEASEAKLNGQASRRKVLIAAAERVSTGKPGCEMNMAAALSVFGHMKKLNACGFLMELIYAEDFAATTCVRPVSGGSPS